MVLKIPADAGEMLHDRDVEALQLKLIADPGLHQQLWRVDRT